MPSLIRFIIVLVFLGGLAYAGMLSLTIFVNPPEKVVTMKVPARDLFGDS